MSLRVPFGGVGESGHGRELSEAGELELWKTVSRYEVYSNRASVVETDTPNAHDIAITSPI